MTMNMSVQPIWGFSWSDDAAMRAARAAGWRRRDLMWERLQERANDHLAAGRIISACRGFHRARWFAQCVLAKTDPRRATSLANAALAHRLMNHPAQASRLYTRARMHWQAVPQGLEHIDIRPRARSSLFHLRMEARHWETYRANLIRRLAAFVAETDETLGMLAAGEPAPHRHYERWRGEKPMVFDDSRKLLSACLLLAIPPT